MIINDAIADAAIEFVGAHYWYNVNRDEETQRDLELAREKLFWMVDAKNMAGPLTTLKVSYDRTTKIHEHAHRSS